MQKTLRFSFIALVVLFFLWGLLTSLNDILVPHMKGAFNLKHWQAQLIQFFFFGAYFLMSIPAGMIIRKVGYKRGIVVGLMLMGLGCFIFFPASELTVYGIFLLGLFVLASGITILQVAANPYVAVIGPEETAQLEQEAEAEMRRAFDLALADPFPVFAFHTPSNAYSENV